MASTFSLTGQLSNPHAKNDWKKLCPLSSSLCKSLSFSILSYHLVPSHHSLKCWVFFFFLYVGHLLWWVWTEIAFCLEILGSCLSEGGNFFVLVVTSCVYYVFSLLSYVLCFFYLYVGEREYHGVLLCHSTLGLCLIHSCIGSHQELDVDSYVYSKSYFQNQDADNEKKIMKRIFCWNIRLIL